MSSNFSFCAKFCAKYELRGRTGRSCCESFGKNAIRKLAISLSQARAAKFTKFARWDCKLFPFDYCMDADGQMKLLCYFKQICLCPNKIAEICGPGQKFIVFIDFYISSRRFAPSTARARAVGLWNPG